MTARPDDLAPGRISPQTGLVPGGNEGGNMHAKRALVTLLLAGLVAACGNSTTPAPSSAPSSDPSAIAALPSGSIAPSTPPSPSATPLPTATPEPTATPVPTPAPTPIPWKTYTSKRYHYKMQYPP